VRLLSRFGTPLRRTAAVIVVVLIVEYLVLPQIAGARKSLHLLAEVKPGWLVAGLALELAALVAYAQLTRSVLPRTADACPSLWTLFRIDLSTLAISHVLPGGGAAGASLGFRLLTEQGVRGTDAAFAMATQGIGSALVLNVILWLGLVATIPARGFHPLTGAVAIAGVLLLGLFASMVLGLTRGEERAVSLLRRIAGRLPLLDEHRVVLVVHRLSDRLGELGRDRQLVTRAATWAAVNWLLDMASLWVFLAAFGWRMDVAGLVVAYGFANVLAVLPVTPAGLGVVEGVLAPTLVGFGAPSAVAILGVISWRLVQFWLPIPAGAAAYLSLRVHAAPPAGAKLQDDVAAISDVVAETAARESK
jgi:uncharacterized protein (TIRG00374 family)